MPKYKTRWHINFVKMGYCNLAYLYKTPQNAPVSTEKINIPPNQNQYNN